MFVPRLISGDEQAPKKRKKVKVKLKVAVGDIHVMLLQRGAVGFLSLCG